MSTETFAWTGPRLGPGFESRVSGTAWLSGIRDGVFAAPDSGPLATAELVTVDRGRVELICSPASALAPATAGLLLSTALEAAARTLAGSGGIGTVLEATSWWTGASVSESASTDAVVATAELVSESDLRSHLEAALVDGGGSVLATASWTLRR